MKQGVRVHQNSCLYEIVSCPRQCGIKFEQHKLETHIKNECPRRLVECKRCDDEGE